MGVQSAYISFDSPSPPAEMSIVGVGQCITKGWLERNHRHKYVIPLGVYLVKILEIGPHRSVLGFSGSNFSPYWAKKAD